MTYQFEDFFNNKYQEMKAIFQKYTETKYLVVELVIVGGMAMHKYNFHPQLGENLFVWGSVFLGTLITYHDEFKIFEDKGFEGIIEDYNDFYGEKYLAVKENFEYYKSFIF